MALQSGFNSRDLFSRSHDGMSDGTERDEVIEGMIAKLNQGEEREYFVGIVGYFIEGVPYSASGLSVDSTATLDIHLTQNGFSCTAFFPPNILQPDTVRKNGIIKKEFLGKVVEIVKVQLDVHAEDIYAISEFVGGTQVPLYLDPDILSSRKTKFISET
jgi:hypothetical protein